MKNQLFTLALAAFSGLLSAQSAYHPMLADDRSWDIFNTTIGPEPCPYIGAYHAFIGGDSVINGLTYKKIVSSPILSSIAFPWCGGFYLGDTVFQSNPFLLREDSAARKVYHYSHDDQAEYVLFDFNLQTGDTLKTTWGDGNWIIDTVFDYTLANGEVRKRFQGVGAGFTDNAYVEGLGYLFGAFTVPYYPLEGWALTTCVRDEDEVLYENSEVGCVTSTMSASDIFENHDFKISPNPFDSQLRLEITDGGARQSFLFELLDPTGRSVLRQEIPDGTTVFNLELPQLPSGIYFWSVGGRFGGRLMKEQ